MASIKEYNRKLKSLNNTRKITGTMKMVSASKLRKAHRAQANARLYAREVTFLTSRIAAAVDSSLHPLLVSHARTQKALIVIVTSDKGLCGAFNHNAHRHVLSWFKENQQKYNQIDLSCCGKKGFQFFKKRMTIRTHYEGVTEKPQFANAARIGNDLMQFYLKGEYDEVYIAYNHFFNPLSQKTVFEKILPIEAESLIESKIPRPTDYIFEPDPRETLNFLIPHFLYFKIYFALLENSAGEHGARMSAMDNATRNASDMIDRYSLFRNRARQEQITKELIEITAGREALE